MKLQVVTPPGFSFAAQYFAFAFPHLQFMSNSLEMSKKTLYWCGHVHNTHPLGSSFASKPSLSYWLSFPQQFSVLYAAHDYPSSFSAPAAWVSFPSVALDICHLASSVLFASHAPPRWLSASGGDATLGLEIWKAAYGKNGGAIEII